MKRKPTKKPTHKKPKAKRKPTRYSINGKTKPIMGRPKRWTAETVLKEAEALIKYAQQSVMPTLEEFAGTRRYSSQRIFEWKKNPDFSEAIKSILSDATGMCKDKFTLAMMKGGLSGKFDKAVSIFLMKSIGGLKDGSEPKVYATATATATSDREKKEEKIEDDADTRDRLKRNMSILGRYGFSSESVES